MPQTAGKKPKRARTLERPERVLIADDEKNIRRTFSQALEPLGLIAETAASGEEALARLQERAFELMLLDLRMPDLDGLEILEEAHRLRPGLPVIVVTAHGTPAVAAEAVRRGAADFAQKPFTPEEFRNLVRRTWPEHREAAAPAPPRKSEDRLPRRVVVPVADPAAQEGALRLAAAYAHAHEGGEVVAVSVLEVPEQTPMSHYGRYDSERVQLLKLLSERARQEARACAVEVRTRALIARAARRAVLELLEEEHANHVILPWTEAVPEPKDRRSPLNTFDAAAVRAIARKASCAVTLAKVGRRGRPGDIAALIGEGRHAPYAARRAFELARSAGIARLRLLRAQPADASGDEPSARAAGLARIRAAAAEAGIPDDKYEAEVIVTNDAARDAAAAVSGCDLVCVGAPERGLMTKTLFGTTPGAVGERLGDEAAFLVARGPGARAQTSLEAFAHRLAEKMRKVVS